MNDCPRDGRMLVIIGDRGCETEARAREIAAAQGSYVSISGRQLVSRNGLENALADAPDTLVVEDPNLGDERVIARLKALVGDRPMVSRTQKGVVDFGGLNVIFVSKPPLPTGRRDLERRLIVKRM